MMVLLDRKVDRRAKVPATAHGTQIYHHQGAYFEGRSRRSDEPLGEIEDAQAFLAAGKAKELGDAMNADRLESGITPSPVE